MPEQAPDACPRPETLHELQSGRLGETASSAVRAHVRQCAACAQRLFKEPAPAVTGLVGPPTHTDLEEVTGEPGAEPWNSLGKAATLELPPGTQLGRYTVLEKLGEGGMGVVYAAYDAELHRKVAVKLLHGERGGTESTAGKARLLREAQALAQLSHPNVVGVHEVGTYEGCVFMAMEFVEGQTLRAWLKQKPRPWRAVLEVFLEAARGLAAAHEKGLVHRDFKPDNVLIGPEGRVHVLDFGLARAAKGPEPEPPDAARGRPARLPTRGEEAASLSDSLSSPLTQVGQVVGTLPYMAPELLEGAPASVRTDVFAFAVSLFEALHGQRPFTKAGIFVPREPPKHPRVPTWLKRAVARGLAPLPEGRYASFRELIAALEDDPAPRRRRALTAAGATLAVAVLVLAAYRLASRRGELCRNEGQRLHGIWDGAVAQRLEQAFDATHAPSAASVWSRTRTVLDSYAQGVVAMRTEACVQTRIQGSQPDTVLALRMACLDRRLAELKAFTDVFGQPDAEMVGTAVKAAAALTPLDICANLTALKSAVPLPEALAARALVEQGRGELARAHALLDAGKFKQAGALADEVLARARPLHYRPFEAEALYLRGAVANRSVEMPRAQELLKEAYVAALAGPSVEYLGQIAADLVAVVWFRGDADGAAYWAKLARSALDAMGGNRTVEMVLEHNLGISLSRTAPGEAEQHLLRQLKLASEGSSVGDQLMKVQALMSLAFVNNAKPEEAVRYNRQALELAETTLGKEHPLVAQILSNLGASISNWRGPVDDAVKSYERALALGTLPETLQASARFTLGHIRADRGELKRGLAEMRLGMTQLEQKFGAKGYYNATSHFINLGDVENTLGHARIALEETRKGIAIAEQSSANAGEGRLGAAHALAGAILLRMGQRAEALRELTLARDLQAKAVGPQSSEVAAVLVGLAEWHLRGHAPERALPLLTQALDFQKKELSADDPEIRPTYLRLGECQLALGHVELALPPLEEALRRTEAAQLGPESAAEARFLLARALWRNGADKSRALQLAEQAEAEYARSEAPVAAALAEVKAWLTHPF